MDAPPTLTDAQAWTHVEAVVQRSKTSFYWAMRSLGEEKRRAMYGIYAFCREVDDIADGDAAPDEKKARLGLWRGEIERLYGGRPRDPVTIALKRPIDDFSLGKEDFRAVIDGMEMDSEDRVRLRDMDELTAYCDRVACAVGRLCVRVFGMEEVDGRELAFALGQALQLTNILRDIAEDAGRDRLYIPADVLTAHGIDAATEDGADIAEILAHRRFTGVFETLAAAAEHRFEQADAVIRRADPVAVRPARMMKENYCRVLAKLMRRGWRPGAPRVGLAKPVKAWIAFRYGLFS